MSPLLDQITAELDRLAALEPSRFPFISHYLDLQPDQHGRDHFDTFVRKELGERLRTFEVGGAERASLDADCEKIRRFLGGIDPAANGLALFACSGRDFFEGLQLPAPIRDARTLRRAGEVLLPADRGGIALTRFYIARDAFALAVPSVADQVRAALSRAGKALPVAAGDDIASDLWREADFGSLAQSRPTGSR